MLAVKGLPKDRRPRIRDLAELLMVEHHSMVELVDRLESAGYVHRNRGDQDRREVLVSLTPKGERILRDLALSHHTELSTRGPALIAALKRVMTTNKTHRKQHENGAVKLDVRNKRWIDIKRYRQQRQRYTASRGTARRASAIPHGVGFTF